MTQTSLILCWYIQISWSKRVFPMSFWQKRVYRVFRFYNLNTTYTWFKVECIDGCSNFIIQIGGKPFSQTKKNRENLMLDYMIWKLIWICLVVLTRDLRVDSFQDLMLKNSDIFWILDDAREEGRVGKKLPNWKHLSSTSIILEGRPINQILSLPVFSQGEML